MWNTALHLARKDIRIFLRDRTALMLALVLPIVLATVFGTAMKGMSGGGGGGGGGIKPLPLLVEDLDGSTQSAQLLERIDSQAGIRVELGSDAHKRVRNGDVPMALVVESGYGADLAAGKVPRLRLLQDPSKTLSVQVLTGRLLAPLAMHTIGEVRGPMFEGLLRQMGFPESSLPDAVGVFDQSVDRIAEIAGKELGVGSEGAVDGGASSGGFDFFTEGPRLLGIETENVMKDDDGPPKSAGISHAFAAMAVMMLMFSLVAGAGTLLDEKEQGTLMRLRVIPKARDSILLGKFLLLAFIGALQLSVLFLFGRFVFDVPIFEHAWPLTVVSAATLFAVAAMGLLFAVVSRTRKQLEGSSTLVILGMSALGGAWFPREMTPDIFQTLGNFTLTAWSMDAYHGILWYGKGVLGDGELSGVWLQVSVLVAVGVVLCGLTRWFFHRRFVG